MNAGARFEYLWADGVKVKEPQKLSAPDYIDALMTWVEEQLNDQSIFPLDVGQSFPKNYLAIVKNIYKRLFRVRYASWRLTIQFCCYFCHQLGLNFSRMSVAGLCSHFSLPFRKSGRPWCRGTCQHGMSKNGIDS
jgi:hypothetical protein